MRAQVQRRANRRIIMRQVGDRLIPVGVTSGRIHPLTGEALAAAGGAGGEGMVISISGNPTENGGEATQGGRGSRRSRRRQHQQAPQEMNGMSGLFNGMAIPGQDLEEVHPKFSWLLFFLLNYPLSLVNDNGGYATFLTRTRRIPTEGRREEEERGG